MKGMSIFAIITLSWRKANINGDKFLSWEEELIWQYNAQKQGKQ